MTKVLGIFGFLQFGWADILDIGMVALLIYLLLSCCGASGATPRC